MDREQNKLIFSQLIKYASIISVFAVLNSLFLYQKGINVYLNTEESLLFNLKVVIVGLGLFYSMNHLSFRVLRKKLSFGQYLKYGSLISVFYAIPMAVFFAVYILKLAPETINQFKEALQEMQAQMQAQMPTLYSQEQITQMADIFYRSPVFLFFSGFFMEFINMFFYTLLFGLFYIIFPKPKNLN